MKKNPKRKFAIVIALVLSVLLFFTGLISGLLANKIAEENAQKELGFLVNYVDTLDSELRSLQIQELFINSLEISEKCEFADAYFSSVGEGLNYYYTIFPNRLEEYEKNQDLTPEYLLLKKEYTRLSLRAWLVAKENRKNCDTAVLPILYFYSKDCVTCVRQGEILDMVKNEVFDQEKRVLIFTLDKDFDESAITLIKDYYSINKSPALIINEEVFQGRLYTSKEIIEALN